MIRSIKWRIALPFVSLILVSMLGVGIYISSYFEQSYIKNLEQNLLAQARLISDELRYNTTNPEIELSLQNLVGEWSGLINARITLVDADGVVLADSEEDPQVMDNHRTRPEINQAGLIGEGASTRLSATTGERYIYVALQVPDDRGQTEFVRVAAPLREVEADISRSQRVILIVSLLVAGIATILAVWITNRSTSQLRELTDFAGRISGGNLEGEIEPSSIDEVGQLTLTLNRMASELRTRIRDLETERSILSAVMNEMSDGVIIVDRDGVVELANPAAEKMFVFNEMDVIGKSLIETVRYHQIADIWQRSLHTAEQYSDMVMINPNRVYLQCFASPMGQALPGSTLLLFQDLTRLRRLETIRQDFITNISHELRTPLASLKALTETLLDGALDDPPAARRFLERMEIEVDALSLMVSELLELSRIESGRVPLTFDSTDPCELILAATQRLQLQAERAGLEIQIECPQDLTNVQADAKRLEQVLVNLLHNSIKFTAPGGKITARAIQDGEMVRFSVQDSGIGIPSDDLPRIFERFYKADRARSSGGTGLGLAISKHLVESHGGRIWAESVEGHGSTFYFSIPMAI